MATDDVKLKFICMFDYQDQEGEMHRFNRFYVEEKSSQDAKEKGQFALTEISELENWQSFKINKVMSYHGREDLFREGVNCIVTPDHPERRVSPGASDGFPMGLFSVLIIVVLIGIWSTT